MRLADTKSAIVSLSAAVRLAASGLRPGLPPLLLELPAVIFFMHASLRTPLILIRMVLFSATNVIELWQAIEEYGASFGGGCPCSILHSKNCTGKWTVSTSGLCGPRKDLFCRSSRIQKPCRGFGNGRGCTISRVVRETW